jgi:hypothetical protein
VDLRADLRTKPDRWYEVRCARVGDQVTLTVVEFLPDGSTEETSETASGPIGTVAWVDKVPPLSIGAKLAPNGELIKSATDQFNGEIANPVYISSGTP